MHVRRNGDSREGKIQISSMEIEVQGGRQRCMTYARDLKTENGTIQLLLKMATPLEADPEEYREAHPEIARELNAPHAREKATIEMPSPKSAEDDGCHVSRSTKPPPPKKAKVSTRGAASAPTVPELLNFVDIVGVHAPRESLQSDTCLRHHSLVSQLDQWTL